MDNSKEKQKDLMTHPCLVNVKDFLKVWSLEYLMDTKEGKLMSNKKDELKDSFFLSSYFQSSFFQTSFFLTSFFPTSLFSSSFFPTLFFLSSMFPTSLFLTSFFSDFIFSDLVVFKLVSAVLVFSDFIFFDLVVFKLVFSDLVFSVLVFSEYGRVFFDLLGLLLFSTLRSSMSRIVCGNACVANRLLRRLCCLRALMPLLVPLM